MPILLLSVDGTNEQMCEFEKMNHVVVDVVMIHESLQGAAVLEKAENNLQIVRYVTTNLLDPNCSLESGDDVKKRVEFAIDLLRLMDVSCGMIVSSRDVLNKWNPSITYENWDLIPM